MFRASRATGRGSVYMAGFDGILSEEAMWAIRSWLDAKFTE
jgi:hypothetical protein